VLYKRSAGARPCRIPLHAVERTDEDPIVIGGGPCTYNPEPIAPFFDLFYIGEGEVVYDQLFDTYLENKKNGGTRLDFLKKACQIPGIYVPQFAEVTYHEDGTVAAFTPSIPEAPEKIQKTACHGYDRGNVSGETGRAVYQGNTGPCTFWRSSAAVSAAAVSARRGLWNRRPENGAWGR